MTRHLFLLMMLGAAVGLPYLASGEFRGTKPKSGPANDHAAPAVEYGTAASGAAPAAAISGHEVLAPRPAAGGAPGTAALAAPEPYRPTPSMDLGQVINFAVTPAWVLTQWPRVSAALAELDVQGYRVTLVSGTHEDDLAGSLTYYFDQQQRVARITFSGSTGDPRKLIALLAGRFGFKPDASGDPAVVVYDVKWNNRAQSELRIRPAKIVRADNPRERYDVELSIRRF